MSHYTQQETNEAITKLKTWLKPGDTVSCISRHTSRSGMSRSISLFAVVDGELTDISYFAARAMGDSLDNKHGGIRIGGCGMDMGFALVYDLASVLWPDGFGCIGDGSGYEGTGIRCPSNDHSNGDRDYAKHGSTELISEESWRAEHWHHSGGYALRHRWI